MESTNTTPPWDPPLKALEQEGRAVSALTREKVGSPEVQMQNSMETYNGTGRAVGSVDSKQKGQWRQE